MPEGFLFKKTEGEIKYFIIPAFEETGLVKHCFTTRLGGVSKGYYSSLNLGTHLTDDLEKVIKNRQLICSALGANLDQAVAAQQIHGKVVYHVKAEDKKRGAYSNEDAIPGTDALITDEPEVLLTTYYADCVPLYILDPVNKAIALVHSGWKGTVLKIGIEALKEMKEKFGTEPKDVLVAIAPSIGPCCYEVDKRVLEEFEKNFINFEKLISKSSEEKAMLDLWEANKDVFIEAGVPEENITLAKMCTSCNTDLFFSYRKEDGKTGRMAAIMMLK